MFPRISQTRLFHNLSYCYVSSHISDNLSLIFMSRDIPRKWRTQALIWHQTWWNFRTYCWIYWLLKGAQGLLTHPVVSTKKNLLRHCLVKIYSLFCVYSWESLKSELWASDTRIADTTRILKFQQHPPSLMIPVVTWSLRTPDAYLFPVRKSVTYIALKHLW